MDWQRGMEQAVEYIEAHLMESMDFAKVAQHAECSSWEFQRMFSFLTHVSLGEYIRKRRLSCAAHDLLATPIKVIDIAMKYGYESPAAFSRAFGKQYGLSPSSAREAGVPLAVYPRMTFESWTKEALSRMSKFSERGYVVRENGAVYFTLDMDATVHWFEEVLGWYGDVVSRNADGSGDYGCVFDYPDEVAVAHLTPFRGFHLFTGEPRQGVVGFIMIDGIEAFHDYVKSRWSQISNIETQHWGAKECQVITIDGCILRFFEEAR
ncbi:helix-turn-helix domain-containing protein [Gorillibacterium sp. CAU 1737]|uniref:helix-turn-helix domain-containing protein n=1 Tax=Gorillibacterium sp. CAU 1737 TaxID=3140362 RepID=UPI003260241F